MDDIDILRIRRAYIRTVVPHVGRAIQAAPVAAGHQIIAQIGWGCKQLTGLPAVVRQPVSKNQTFLADFNGLVQG